MNQKVYKKRNPFQTFIYYWRVWRTVVSKSLSKSVAYRLELLSKVFRTLLILLIQLLLIQSIFSGTEFISGWTIEEYYLLVGIFNFVIYISWGIFNVNLWRVEEKVLKGEFDTLLLYPTGSIFAASFTEFFLDDAIASLSGVILIVYYVIVSYSTLTFSGIMGGIVVIFSGFIIWFSIHLFVAAFNFVIVKNGLLDLTKSFTRIGSFPPDIFSQNIRIVLFTFFPIAFIAAVPTRVITGDYGWNFVVYSILVALISLFLASRVWRKAIKSYTSAGG
jgi:ABC-2 type transport system permease protein